MNLYVVLCGVFHLSAVIQSAAVTQDIGVISVNAGDSVTLHCFYNSQVAMHFSWYQQTLGGRPELLSSVYKHEKQSKVFTWMEKNLRFSVKREEGMNNLHIADAQFSDSATYFCGSSHSNIVEFGVGVFLSVKGTNHKKVVQGPVSETIKPGGSVTLNCTVHTGSCEEEHSVNWFRQETGQGILYVHENKSNHVPTAGSPSQGCVYHLQKTNLSSSDAGTYYCAVASCGEVLFGNGSKVLVQADVEDHMEQMRILVWLSIIRIGLIFFFVTICFLVYIYKLG
ncbi:hypothetical protein OYC64_004589 [Pagothenia borchgrevinki]|uniref:Ig-like domain-containing protein n=1 Tax=Pagothenia borchgrevinki TaxID=8213 RepID=A0ABD2FXS5_PAGBO